MYDQTTKQNRQQVIFWCYIKQISKTAGLNKFFNYSNRKRSQTIANKPKLVNLQDIQIDKSVLSSISAKSFVILNAKNGEKIYGRKEDKEKEIASLTKIMTCYIVQMEMINNYIKACEIIKEQKINSQGIRITISKKAASLSGTTASLNRGIQNKNIRNQQGDQLRLCDLLYGMMLPSGNDAAYAIAEYLGQYLVDSKKEGYFQRKAQEEDNLQGYYVQLFIKRMNKQSKQLDLQKTYFENPHGLGISKNKSTVVSIGQLIKVALKNEMFSEIIKTKNYSCQVRCESNKTKQIQWQNTNKLVQCQILIILQLNKIECYGVKTGITATAGPCLATYFKNALFKIEIIIVKYQNYKTQKVLFKCKTLDDRFNEALILYEQVKEHFKNNYKV